MPSFYTILTDVGQAKLANAIALGQTIEITDLAVGDGNGALPTPETSRTALVNEVRRAPINLSEVDDQNPNWVVVEQVLPPDVGGWTIREIGVFDIDGDLIGYGNYPETYKPVLAEGSSRTQTIRFVMEVSDTQAITLKVDPSVVLATRGYADSLMDTHEASRNHPAGTTSAQGMLRLATAARVKQYNAADPVTAAALRDSGLLGAAVTVVTAADSPKTLTVAEAGLVLVDASAGDVSLNLPASAGNKGLAYTIARTDSSPNAVTVTPEGTKPDTIEGGVSASLPAGRRMMLTANGGTDWTAPVMVATDAEAQAFTPGRLIDGAALLAAFGGGNGSKAVPGYQKLPNGLIVQWTGFSSSSGNATANFPVSFPNSVLTVVGSMVDKSSGTTGGLTMFFNGGGRTLSSQAITLGGWDGGAWNGELIAIGY